MPRKKSKEYLPRRGFRVSKKAAAAIGPVIEQLVSSGKGTAEQLVQVASDPRCPAHRYFEWDDKKAAHEHRLSQARLYFRCIVTVEPATKEPMRAFLRVRNPGKKGSSIYESRETVRDSVSLMAEVMQQALDQLDSWSKEYEQLRSVAKFAGIFDAVDKLLDSELR